jgi:hypothetical protein
VPCADSWLNGLWVLKWADGATYANDERLPTFRSKA